MSDQKRYTERPVYTPAAQRHDDAVELDENRREKARVKAEGRLRPYSYADAFERKPGDPLHPAEAAAERWLAGMTDEDKAEYRRRAENFCRPRDSYLP